jgi:hypothetical protein
LNDSETHQSEPKLADNDGFRPLNPSYVLIEAVGEGELRLRSRRQAIKEAQALVARYLPKGRDLMQELIDERRDEAARE